MCELPAIVGRAEDAAFGKNGVRERAELAAGTDAGDDLAAPRF